MKLLFSFLFLISTQLFAQDEVVHPRILECDAGILRDYVKPAEARTITIPKNIEIERREIEYGDPAVWSLLHMVKIEFPVGKKKACFLIDNFFLAGARSVGYSLFKGRLIELIGVVATMPDDGSISSRDVVLNIRVNQSKGTISFE